MTAPIGHNSSLFNQTMAADIEKLLGEDTEKLFIYAQWHVGDYIIGTQGMSLEIEGAYQRFLMRLYARGKPLPDNDDVMAVTMSLSRTIWRRIKQALVDLGKIVIRSGYLTNLRFEKERRKRAETMIRQSQAAHARWDKRREQVAPSEKNPNFSGNLPEISEIISGNNDAKPNEINGSEHKNAYANQEPITNIEEVPVRAHARLDPQNWEMLAFQSPEERKAQREIWRLTNGDISISENLRDQLTQDFPRTPIGPTLTIIKSESRIQDSASKLLNDIMRKFSYAERDEINRDRRYAEKASQKPPPTARTESTMDKISREASEAIAAAKKFDWS